VIKIITAPNPILSSAAKPISRVDSSVVRLIEQMKKVLIATTDPKGVGLAAPQVGKPLQIFIAKPTDKSKILVFINPRIVASSRYQVLRIKKDSIHDTRYKIHDTKLEGCLSLPTIWGPVLRASSLTLTFLDEQGIPHKQKFVNFLATIIQHEMDHLMGILFPKKVLEQKGTLYKSHKNKKGEDEFEEIEI
jgi:peptide deformylase